MPLAREGTKGVGNNSTDNHNQSPISSQRTAMRARAQKYRENRSRWEMNGGVFCLLWHINAGIHNCVMKNITLIMVIGFASMASAQLTGEARILQEKRDAKIAEINKIYKEQLAKLKTKALENRDIAAAEAIQAEIDESKSIGPLAAPNYPIENIIGKWKRVGSGTKYDGDMFEFASIRKGSYNGSLALKVRFNSSTKVIIIDSGLWIDELTFTNDPDKLDGITAQGMTYQLVRFKK